MALRNIQPSSFNPAQLQPADTPSMVPYGVGSGPDTQEYIRQTPMKGPDGRIYIEQQVIGVDGQPRGAASYVSKNPDGTTQRYQPNGDGTFMEGISEKRGFMETVFGDKKLMAFLAVAGAGAAAGTMWGTGGAGGSMLGGGTGATPGVVAGGTMGTSGLGAATGTGLLGTMGGQGGYDQAGLDQLIQDSEARDAARIAAGAAGGGAASNIPQWLRDLGGSLGIDDLGDLVREGGSLALMREMYNDQKGNAQEWRDFMKSSTPDLGFYQGKLKESYENPGAWLQGPEYQAAQSVVHNKLQRSDAAKGRLANDFGRQSQLQDHAMGALAEHRNGLGQLVNQQQNTYSGQAGGALENAQNAENDWMKNLMQWMQSQGKN